MRSPFCFRAFGSPAATTVNFTMDSPDEAQAENNPLFICDAMLGGLARWLRAAGYSAEFNVHIGDGELVRRALTERKVLLTSDSGIMRRYAVTEGLTRAVFIPLGLSVIGELAHVFRELELPLLPSRCMDCNGLLRHAALEEVAEQVPEKVRRCCNAFFVCESCAKVLWDGTHWSSIKARLKEAQQHTETAHERD